MTEANSPASVNKDISGITGLAAAASSMDLSGMEAAADNKEKLRLQMELMKQMDEFNRGAMIQGVQALAGAFDTLGDSIGGAAGGILSLIGTMAQQIAQGVATIANLNAQGAAYRKNAGDALADATAKTFAAHAGIPFVGVAMGIGFVASMISMIRSLPQFAEGAYADRPTLGIFGEKGPELVVPERKLDEAFERNADKMGINGKVKFEIDGRKLVGVLQAEENRNNYRP